MQKKLSNNAIRVLESRYLKRDKQGNLAESPNELFRRVAKAISKAEYNFGDRSDVDIWEQKFYAILSALDFLPNSPTLMNAGTDSGQLSACFVLPIEDTMPDIFETLKTTALIQQSGGGTGFNFSRLRPDGSIVDSTQGKASGPVAFMKIFDAATENIKQGGKRRGANMSILNIDHPDILSFISAKKEQKVLTNFNLSVGVSDAFMIAVENNDDWTLKHESSSKKIIVKARDIWDAIIQSAWETGDPGIIFLDEINRHNPTPAIGAIEATNPCGEVPLLPFEACNLGSVNLFNMVDEEGVNWNKLEETVVIAIRFLDNVIEMNSYVTPEIEKLVTGNRKVGLGVMGWAEMLIKLEISYDSEDALDLAERLMKFINEKSFEASRHLAAERGSFPNWKESIYYPDYPIRNATRTSIAPTGTISMIANTSSSIEPLFSLAYQRKHILENDSMFEINPLFLASLDQYNLSLPKNIRHQDIVDVLGQLPSEKQKLFHTAMDISAEYHIKHQVAFQKHTDNAVSKTINMAENSTIDDISRAFMLAWKLKAKGITIYRDNSKDSQVLNQLENEKKENDLPILHTKGTQSCKICVE